MEYDNTNTGASFKNTYKKKESQPDMTGTLNVEGVDYRMSGWFNESEKQVNTSSGRSLRRMRIVRRKTNPLHSRVFIQAGRSFPPRFFLRCLEILIYQKPGSTSERTCGEVLRTLSRKPG